MSKRTLLICRIEESSSSFVPRLPQDRKKIKDEKKQIALTENLLDEGSVHTLRIPRIFVNGVVEAPRGAHFTECPPDYGRDEDFQKLYAATAKDPTLWESFKSRYLETDSHQEYLRMVDSQGEVK